MDKESKKPWDKKIAVAIIHGAGKEDPDYAKDLIDAIEEEFVKLVKDVKVKECLEFKPIHWAPILEEPEKALWSKMENLCWVWKCLRKFIVSNFGDVVAYQSSPRDRTRYDDVHAWVAEDLSCLAHKAGNYAPLCIIAHSLGTVIASNYLYDISYEKEISRKVHNRIGESFLAKGKTLVLFYTLGCPIPLWNVCFPDFKNPIQVPAKEVGLFDPRVEGGWINFYERHDVFSFPLSTVIDHNKQPISDYPVKIGGFVSHMFPTCHYNYWKNRGVAAKIAEGLATTWRSING